MTTETINEIAKRLPRRAETIDAMRRMLNLLEANPIIPLPSFHQVNVFSYNKDTMSDIARAMKPVAKEVISDWFVLNRSFSDSVSLHINFVRDDVCERVVTGTEEIAEKITPAYTKEIVEWICPDSIMGTDND